ncbi:hypothetical protein KM043_004948 [Ampulex compressa]|nr:hypothetical protein KM043_004948 [Ampulex compressa]
MVLIPHYSASGIETVTTRVLSATKVLDRGSKNTLDQERRAFAVMVRLTRHFYHRSFSLESGIETLSRNWTSARFTKEAQNRVPQSERSRSQTFAKKDERRLFAKNEPWPQAGRRDSIGDASFPSELGVKI